VKVKNNPELLLLLKKVYGNCIPDVESNCMIWTGAVQPCGGSPAIKSNGAGTSLRRLVLSIAKGKAIEPSLMATYSCSSPQCVRLEHMKLVSRKEIQRRTDSQFNAFQRLNKSQKLMEKARARAKLSPEIAQEIRNSQMSQRQIAKLYGVSQSTVNSIKTGKTWVDRSNPFWRMAA